jgi:hypothetical protein
MFNALVALSLTGLVLVTLRTLRLRRDCPELESVRAWRHHRRALQRACRTTHPSTTRPEFSAGKHEQAR